MWEVAILLRQKPSVNQSPKGVGKVTSHLKLEIRYLVAVWDVTFATSVTRTNTPKRVNIASISK